MHKITAILVDDEQKALEGLQLKVNRFFENITIIEQCSDPEKAIDTINELQPDLLFLDIEMPILSGFDVLSKLNNLDVEIIFVTAYNNYAIEAIKHTAIGYVLKPIDNDELKHAVQNALKNINNKTTLAQNQNLLYKLGSNQSKTRLAVPTNEGLLFIEIVTIIRFEGVEGYTKIVLENQKEILSSYSIGKFVKMLDETVFCLTHKSHCINLNYVTSIHKEGSIYLKNGDTIPLTKTKKMEFIKKMENL